MALIEFGRNGWFGVISDEITFENVRIVAQAVADYLNDTSAPGPVALGYDTRFLSREYAWAIQQATGYGYCCIKNRSPHPSCPFPCGFMAPDSESW
mgnify:CR=1 FL=1